ncbi:hypothetical protein C0J52_05011 [Blattella germanica]|nr:hypothetical protein C0J52_05011 [Blattella germanica]
MKFRKVSRTSDKLLDCSIESLQSELIQSSEVSGSYELVASLQICFTLEPQVSMLLLPWRKHCYLQMLEIIQH